jgi:hypothetical protein
MQYTALQNYSVNAGSPHVLAQKAHVMNAFKAIPISTGELMVPEDAGVVIQAKSGINAIRVSGTATTTAGLTGTGTTANQIQFYSNDTIVGAFDQLGLFVKGINSSSNITVATPNLFPLTLSRHSVNNSAAFGVGIDFRLNAPNNISYAQIYGGLLANAAENTRGYIAIDVNNMGNFGSNPKSALIYGDIPSGVIINVLLTLNSTLLSKSITVSEGNIIYFNNPANTYSWRIKTDSSNVMRIQNQYGTDYFTCWDGEGVRCHQNLGVNSIIFHQSLSTKVWFMNQGAGSGNEAGNLHFGVYGYNPEVRSYVNPSNGAFTINSDLRLKKSITPLNSALSSIMNLNPVNFLYNYQSDDAKPNTGFIAQDVQKVINNVVDLSDKSDEHSYLGVNMSGFVPYLVKAIQEQQSLINKLTKRLDILEKA